MAPNQDLTSVMLAGVGKLRIPFRNSSDGRGPVAVRRSQESQPQSPQTETSQGSE